METDKVLERIRGLISKAESLEASGDQMQMNEAQACRERADQMMQKYAVEEWKVMQAAPVASRAKPTRIKVNIGDGDNAFLGDIATLVNIVSKFCKCSSIWMGGSGMGSPNIQEYCYVYGYESDLRYFEMLFTQLHLHMLGAIFPKPDPTKTLQENAYELHNAGLNWFDIAKAYGWYQVLPEAHEPVNMYVNRNTEKRATWAQSIGPIKKAYQAEIRRRGEQPLRVPANGSSGFRRNAAAGYLARIGQRLREISGARGSGTELVLADKSQNIDAAMSADFPKMKMAASKRAAFNPTAYKKGTVHANTAALNPQAGSGSTKALGN